LVAEQDRTQVAAQRSPSSNEPANPRLIRRGHSRSWFAMSMNRISRCRRRWSLLRQVAGTSSPRLRRLCWRTARVGPRLSTWAMAGTTCSFVGSATSAFKSPSIGDLGVERCSRFTSAKRQIVSLSVQ